MNADDFARLRQSMIAEIAAQAIYVSARIGKAAFSRRVMQVLDEVPRHAFVPIELQEYAYANTPLPIGFDKTISQPFIVALMTDLLEIEPHAHRPQRMGVQCACFRVAAALCAALLSPVWPLVATAFSADSWRLEWPRLTALVWACCASAA